MPTLIYVNWCVFDVCMFVFVQKMHFIVFDSDDNEKKPLKLM